jgi:hypothetical protein
MRYYPLLRGKTATDRVRGIILANDSYQIASSTKGSDIARYVTSAANNFLYTVQVNDGCWSFRRDPAHVAVAKPVKHQVADYENSSFWEPG